MKHSAISTKPRSMSRAVRPPLSNMTDLRPAKGVVVAMTYEEAEAALRDMLLGESFGKGRVVVEDFLGGRILFHVCCVGQQGVSSCNGTGCHKRAYDGDKA